MGDLSLIRVYYADLNFSLERKDAGQYKKHIIGLGIYNNREGDYLNKFRVMGRYALHIPLKKDLTLAAGASVHVINYNFHASTSGASGTDFNWSGTISSTLYAPTYTIAIAINDLNSPTIKPINYEFKIPRFITLHGYKIFNIFTDTKLKLASRCNWSLNTSSATSPSFSSYNALLGFIFSNNVSTNGFLHLNKGWGLSFDIERIKLYHNYLNFSLAYFRPNKTYYPTVSQFELNISYLILQK